ncbi:Kae1-associated serine/threonine protein kinase [Candidatus Woesearchaeota archaeon]|nr:Kae1-associated serine/threonine protein kinase [Candidatus Woesearchaeota archaeon]
MQIAQGAEAVVYEEKGRIVKVRKKKGYRLPELDASLRKSRTRRENKIFEKLQELGFVPKLIGSSDKSMKIEMERIKGKQLRDTLTKANCRKLCREAGEKIGMMHDKGIIHGDLTTSNMIFDGKVKFIDFGLSFFSERAEDKAVDLHVLKETLKARHNGIWKACFDSVIKGYKGKNKEEVMKRLDAVEARGRYKGKS